MYCTVKLKNATYDGRKVLLIVKKIRYLSTFNLWNTFNILGKFVCLFVFSEIKTFCYLIFRTTYTQIKIKSIFTGKLHLTTRC